MTKAELREWVNGCYHFAWQLAQIDTLERYYHPHFMGIFNQQDSFDLHFLKQRIIECSAALKMRGYRLHLINASDTQIQINANLSAQLRYGGGKKRIWRSTNKLLLKNSKIIGCEIKADTAFIDHPLF